MRDYYEPGLLTRLLKHEPLPPPRPLAEPNRAQPEVEIARVEQQKNHPDLVTVTVAVANVTERSRGVSAGQPRQSGVYDLRLFRNRQLVGQFPDGSTPAKPIGEESESNYAEALLSWRRTTQVKLDAKGQRQIRFENIRLPVGAEDPPPVEFSAYAFNEDRVKSRTARKFFSPRSGAQSFPALKGRAYLINIGVNASENGAWSLNFAADDARRIGEVLSEELRGTGNYQEVVQVSLLSDYSLEGKIKEKLATRANIEAVFHKLAGKPVADNLIKRIPRAAKLQTARPEDLVIISFSSHGIRTAKGDFYLLPFDTGKGSDKKVTPDLLAHSISSDDLSTWLKPIDAGEIVLIVDACHAASAIESKGFKPGPLGSRGFGQLAYDKGMVVLAATQADNVAIESPKFRQSLLTHALVEEGIKQRKAAMKDPRGRIYLTNWLNYAVGRVPALFAETTNKKLSKSKTGGDKDLKAQKPELFDFRDNDQEVLIEGPNRAIPPLSSRRKT